MIKLPQQLLEQNLALKNVSQNVLTDLIIRKDKYQSLLFF